MTTTFAGLHPVLQALLAGGFTWGMTALGAALVLLTRTMNRRLLDVALGFAAGVMIAASFWSLLAPAIDMAETMGQPAWMPATIGFLAGGAFLRILDRVLPHLHLNEPIEHAEGPQIQWRRTTLLVLAIVLHNIPEGLAVGVAFGAVAAGSTSATLAGAIVLALGIGIQNLPEGFAVALPLRGDGVSRFRAFWYGQLSGVVEPVAAVIGAAAVVVAAPLLPYALGFAAGAMIYVVIEELIPESQTGGHADIATLGAMGGFALMMVLDVAFG